jgi:superfamily II DNA or RNA helicase
MEWNIFLLFPYKERVSMGNASYSAHDVSLRYSDRKDLRDDQREALARMIAKERSVFQAGTGFGKTITAIEFALMYIGDRFRFPDGQEEPVTIVITTPTSVLKQFATSAKKQRLHEAAIREGIDVIYMTHTQFVNDFMKYSHDRKYNNVVLIVDEAHRFAGNFLKHKPAKRIPRPIVPTDARAAARAAANQAAQLSTAAELNTIRGTAEQTNQPVDVVITQNERMIVATQKAYRLALLSATPMVNSFTDFTNYLYMIYGPDYINNNEDSGEENHLKQAIRLGYHAEKQYISKFKDSAWTDFMGSTNWGKMEKLYESIAGMLVMGTLGEEVRNYYPAHTVQIAVCYMTEEYRAAYQQKEDAIVEAHKHRTAVARQKRMENKQGANGPTGPTKKRRAATKDYEVEDDEVEDDEDEDEDDVDVDVDVDEHPDSVARHKKRRGNHRGPKRSPKAAARHKRARDDKRATRRSPRTNPTGGGRPDLDDSDTDESSDDEGLSLASFFYTAGQPVPVEFTGGGPGDGQLTERIDPFMAKIRQASNSLYHLEPKAMVTFRLILERYELGGIVVYSNFLDNGMEPIAGLLALNKHTFGVINGGVSKNQRVRYADSFNDPNDPLKILFISAAGAEGIDLKAVRTIIILEPHFNESRLDQVIGRGVRYKSHLDLPLEHRDVVVYRMVTTKTPFEEAELQGKPHFFPVNEWMTHHGFLTKNGNTADTYVTHFALRKQSLINEHWRHIQNYLSREPPPEMLTPNAVVMRLYAEWAAGRAAEGETEMERDEQIPPMPTLDANRMNEQERLVHIGLREIYRTTIQNAAERQYNILKNVAFVSQHFIDKNEKRLGELDAEQKKYEEHRSQYDEKTYKEIIDGLVQAQVRMRKEIEYYKKILAQDEQKAGELERRIRSNRVSVVNTMAGDAAQAAEQRSILARDTLDAQRQAYQAARKIRANIGPTIDPAAAAEAAGSAEAAMTDDAENQTGQQGRRQQGRRQQSTRSRRASIGPTVNPAAAAEAAGAEAAMTDDAENQTGQQGRRQQSPRSRRASMGSPATPVLRRSPRRQSQASSPTPDPGAAAEEAAMTDDADQTGQQGRRQQSPRSRRASMGSPVATPAEPAATPAAQAAQGWWWGNRRAEPAAQTAKGSLWGQGKRQSIRLIQKNEQQEQQEHMDV